ncbi:uncharacterized mitochondrial protein AtMg00310-like [Rutidosis leptorrhynchoides]|uniref:uncharacterized mitochondrial protein AtMg00310-like n=1 Tax=Rutidosis leptorrhynchoides TaxID=125765 RepID=UPI003A99C0C0
MAIREQIPTMLPFDEGVLPVRYLGVPLLSSRLLYRDCRILVERVKNKVTDWKKKFLSFAGRVQLIISVLTSMQDDGGLSIKSLKWWNVALMSTHIWRILENKDSLWVKWIHAYHLSNHSFREVPVKPDVSWSWRKLLNAGTIIRQHIYYVIGDGQSALAWFDVWYNLCPLQTFISWQDIHGVGFNKHNRVCDIVVEDEWNWPLAWYIKYPQLHMISDPNLTTTSV